MSSHQTQIPLQSRPSSQRYPKPGQIGGTLIRHVVGLLRRNGIKLPITSDILIAVSAGSDSVGLAHLILHYGRRVVPREKVKLLHVNHGWRGEESDQDEAYVRMLGKRWNVPVRVHQLKGPPQEKGASWEEKARQARKAVFIQEASQWGAKVFTAHQADDLAETVLWRLFTGASQTHGGGVAVQHGVEIRPFLTVRKKGIESYLKEVNETFRVDSTNYSGRFLRSQMRLRLMPELERLFPKAIEHLVTLALNAQSEVNSPHLTEGCLPWEVLFRASGLKARRVHFEMAQKDWIGQMHLPEGWRLIHEKKYSKHRAKDRWILEKSL